MTTTRLDKWTRVRGEDGPEFRLRVNGKRPRFSKDGGLEINPSDDLGIEFQGLNVPNDAPLEDVLQSIGLRIEVSGMGMLGPKRGKVGVLRLGKAL